MMIRCGNVRAVAGVVAMLAVSGVALADSSTLLGKIEFPNSGAAEAQDDFLEGVLYMHNFEYDEAAAAFKRARETDPDFAMAYWGEAMTLNHPLWHQQSRTTAEEILERLGRTPDARAAKCGTQREKDYLHAAEVLFGMTEESKTRPKDERDVLYREAMRRLHETYPDDLEATTFYGLSILGATEEREYAPYMKAAAVLTKAWDANRMHPGAAHYLIHCYDDPVHAPLGLPMARAYAKIAPSAAHAQHMTSHIFIALGMWDDLVPANEIAVEMESKSAEGDAPSYVVGHYSYWLMYGLLQQGRIQDARKILAIARERLDRDATQGEKRYFGAMYARYVIDSEDAAAEEELAAPLDAEVPSPYYHFARAYMAIKQRDADAAEASLGLLQAIEGGSPEVAPSEGVVAVMRKQLDGMAALLGTEPEKGIALLRESVEDADALPFRFGPPEFTKPPRESLGEALTIAGQPGEAVEVFQAQLEETPLRAQSLRGLARAAGDRGDHETEREAYRRLAAIWHAADASAPGYDEVMQTAARTD